MRAFVCEAGKNDLTTLGTPLSKAWQVPPFFSEALCHSGVQSQFHFHFDGLTKLLHRAGTEQNSEPKSILKN